MFQRYFVVCLSLFLSSCTAPKDTFSLTPSAGQEAMVRDGVPALVSSKRHIAFIRPAASQQASADRPRFVIALLNRGKQPATFSVATVAVEVARPRKVRLRVYTHHELMAEVESRRNAQLVVSALAGAAGAVSASQAGYGYTTGSYTRTSPYGASHGTYSATNYNPAIAQAAANANADRTADNMVAIEGQAQGMLNQLQASVIKDHTLMPGESHGGLIVVDAPEKSDAGAEYTITLQFDGEVHTFQVAQKRQAS